MDMKTRDNVIILYPEGRLDIESAPQFESDIDTVTDSNPDSHIIINLEQVISINSAGIRVILKSANNLGNNNRMLHLCSPGSVLEKIFSVIKLDSMVKVFSSEDEAIQSLCSAAAF